MSARGPRATRQALAAEMLEALSPGHQRLALRSMFTMLPPKRREDLRRSGVRQVIAATPADNARFERDCQRILAKLDARRQQA